MQTYKSTVIYGKRGEKIVKNVDEVDDVTKYIKYTPSRFIIELSYSVIGNRFHERFA